MVRIRIRIINSNINVVSANIIVKLQGKKIPFQIDIGASVNVISQTVFKTLNKINLKKSLCVRRKKTESTRMLRIND